MGSIDLQCKCRFVAIMSYRRIAREDIKTAKSLYYFLFEKKTNKHRTRIEFHRRLLYADNELFFSVFQFNFSLIIVNSSKMCHEISVFCEILSFIGQSIWPDSYMLNLSAIICCFLLLFTQFQHWNTNIICQDRQNC